MNTRGPEILALLLAAGTLLHGLFADVGTADTDEPDRGVLQDEVFLFAPMPWI